MDYETTRALMLEQIDKARSGAMSSVYGWGFEVTELQVVVEMKHRRNSKKQFLLRVTFEDFPRRPPSYVFVDETHQQTDQAWPPNVRHGAAPPGICTPGTREFHEHWHKNDAAYPWNHEKYPFIETLQRIHRLMEQGVGG